MAKNMDRGDLGDPCNPDDIEPDRGLITWEKWVKDRQRRTKELGEGTGRPPADLVMNLGENLRGDKERKEVLQNAQVPRKLGTCRGSLWEPPARLTQHCYCEPVYQAHRTKAEIGRPPVIEHIGVPRAIMVEEKGVTGTPERKLCEKLDEGYKRYRNIREEKFKSQIKKIDPFRPRLSGLIVKGKKPEPPPVKPPLPTITITPPPQACACEEESGIFALRINNSVFIKNERRVTVLSRMREEPWYEDCTSWHYYFNVPERRPGRAKLFLHNLGTVSIRYCWKKVNKPIPYVPEDMYEQAFFFNKNEDVLYPGETRDFCFTFVSEKRGIFNEVWEFSTINVHFLYDSSPKFTIILSGDATDNILTNTTRIQKLQSRLESKANKFCIARKILLDIIDQATTVEPLIYPYKNMFVEGDIFVVRNPIYYYHQSEVEQLKQTFKEMAPGGEWDLYVASWRSVMKEKMYEQRMQYYDLLKKSHKAMLKPWIEDDSLTVQKHSIVKIILSRLADEFDKEHKALSLLYNVVGMDSVSAVENLHNKYVVSMKSNVFYIHMLEHVGNTIELCAGALSSLDRNRWIDIDFCTQDNNNEINRSKSQLFAATLPSTSSIKNESI
ncbi:MYCBP-associated protein [Plutella xylostella]|uniref:MYCBP-associated protein n=1 Tax=Plutella xylostella TaxID=51655 RepID=UPI0020323EC4|nr:MYCBP-associated protein [Plutella xylostella]